MRRTLVAFAALVFLGPATFGSAAPAPLWLAVGPPELTAALAPLEKARRAEGFRTRVARGPVGAVLDPSDPPAYLLLVGDDAGAPEKSAPGEKPGAGLLPAPRRKLYRWRAVQRAEYAADMLLGDVDQDRVPDFPVGRIPVRTPEEVSAVVAKILAYERRAPAVDDLRVIAWGGAPGYGGMIDAMATGLLVSTVYRLAPPWADRYLLSSSASSPYCGWPPEQPATFDRELSRGAVLGAILAHASARYVYAMEHEGDSVIWNLDRVRADFAKGEPTAPLALLACDAGDFTGTGPCLGEVLLAAPGGPVAVVAATTESHPLTNYYTGEGLLRAMDGTHRRIGDLWLAAQRSILPAREFLIEKALAGAEGSLEDPIDIDKLKRDQLLMYEILGDPATRLRLPGPLAAEVTRTEDGVSWRVTKPDGATSLTVGLRAGTTPVIARGGTDEKSMREALKAANAPGAFRTIATLGPDVPWEGTVTGEGWLRLVATTPHGLLVFVRRL